MINATGGGTILDEDDLYRNQELEPTKLKHYTKALYTTLQTLHYKIKILKYYIISTNIIIPSNILHTLTSTGV